jgi:predicted metal-dependent hydrolase
MQLTLQLTSPPAQQELEPAGWSLRNSGTVFVRHRWARRYILRVLDDGRLRVTLPRWGSKKEAMAFVERSAAWIAKQLRAH